MNGRIFRVMLAAQARYVAPFLALAILIAVALPLANLQGLDAAGALKLDRTGLLLAQSSYLAGMYPVLALCVGIFLAVATWLPDVHWRWVYVLTLPIERGRLALLRLGTGFALILPVALTLWLAGLLAAAVADAPEVVRSYPGALALRFAAGAASGFLVGSLGVLAGRKLWLLPAAFLLIILAGALGVDFSFRFSDLLFLHPLSPLHTLAGQWLLFDV
jgi:hypothetical protein